MNKKLTIEQELELCDDYKSLIPKGKLQKKYEIGWRTLRKILNKYNIETNSQTSYLTGRKKKSMYEYWVIRHGKEIADEKMKDYGEKRSKIHSGKSNPMYGKAAPNGSGQGWKGWYGGFYFRSLRELSYVLYLDDNDIEWETAEKKKFRMKYQDYNGTERTYAPDFIVDNNKLIEIKPKKLQNSPLVRLKTTAAIKFCKENNLTFEIIDFPVDPNRIKLALDHGKINFARDYEERFLKYINTN